jgi:putative MATE family efflux protein
LKVSVTNSNIIRLALPITLALIIPQISFLTNTAFLGRLGERELGVNGITGIFYLTLSMVGYGLSNGIQVIMARRAGEGDYIGHGHAFKNGILLTSIFSICLVLISFWLAPLIFTNGLHDTENVRLSISYIRIRALGLPFLMLAQLANAFFISSSRSRYLIYGSLASTLTNIIFDYFLIFGKIGFTPLGLLGAAWASILADVAYCSTMYLIFYFHKLYEKYPLIGKGLDIKLTKRSLKVASPLIVQYIFSIGGWQLFFIFVEHLGQRELAASQILRSIFGIVGTITWAFASTCNTMVSNLIGQGKKEEVLHLIAKIAKLSLSFTSVICVILLVFSDQFLALYRDDPALIDFARPSLYIITLATLIMAVSTVLFNGVVGTGNTVTNLCIEVTCVLTYIVYCYFIIEKYKMGLSWAWASEFVYWTSLLSISFLYLRSGRWKRKQHI